MQRTFVIFTIALVCFLGTNSFLINEVKAVEYTADDFIRLLAPKIETDTTGVKGLAPTTRTLYKPFLPSATIKLQFKLNSAALTITAANQLDELGQAFQSNTLKGYTYQIQGHTCSLGSASYNLRLSRQRAMAVRKYFTRNFNLSNVKLRVKGYGESRPLPYNSNANEAERRLNRRVVIINTLESFHASKQEKPGYHTTQQKNPRLNVKVKCIRDGREEILQNGCVLTQKDNYMIEVKPLIKSYVYIYKINSSGNAEPLFPEANFSSKQNPLNPNAFYRMPEKDDQWFYPDNQKGKEYIVVLASKSPIRNHERIAGNQIKTANYQGYQSAGVTSGVFVKGIDSGMRKKRPTPTTGINQNIRKNLPGDAPVLKWVFI
ncbi:OmpA family protein [Desulfococcaceae bacterium HSG9]|nr:OmpA family protein [Desulfococcaceae bacterium HSG9]